MSNKSRPQYLNLSEYVSGEKAPLGYKGPDNNIENYGSFSISAAVRYPYNPSYFGMGPTPSFPGVS